MGSTYRPSLDVAGENTPPAPPPDDTLQRNFALARDVDPTLLQDMDKVLGPPPSATPAPTNSQAGKVATLWQRAREMGSNIVSKAQAFDKATSVEALSGGTQTQSDRYAEGLGKAVARGTIEGANEVSNTIFEWARKLSEDTGLYKIGRNEEEQRRFLIQQDRGQVDNLNPLQVSPDFIEKTLGHSDNIVESLTEGSASFAVGWEFAGKVLASVPGIDKLAKGSVTGQRFVRALRMFLAGYSSSDPHAKRLSDMAAEYLDKETGTAAAGQP